MKNDRREEVENRTVDNDKTSWGKIKKRDINNHL